MLRLRQAITKANFSLEHIIAQQALTDQPTELKKRLTVDQRSGNILLCTKPLKIRGNHFSQNGCNSWKGRCYDKMIREILNGTILNHQHQKYSNQHTIALLALGYIAVVSKFGYQVALTPAGILSGYRFLGRMDFGTK